ncbi:hypothetical protein [Hymenobacter tenuis]
MKRTSDLTVSSPALLSLSELAEHTARSAEAGLSGAKNTAKENAGDLKRIGAWCQQHALVELSAFVDTLAGFTTHLAEANKKVATIQRYCAAINKAHARRGLGSPADDKKFKVRRY